MKKKKTGIWIAAITFFTLLLIGTFFHKKIDGLFRMKVAAVYPQECRVETESVIELDGEQWHWKESVQNLSIIEL